MGMDGDGYMGKPGLLDPTLPIAMLPRVLFLPFMSGTGVFSGSNSFCNAKSDINASFPELCIVHWTSILREERRLPRESVDPEARN
jgi:hypothetical protein